MYTYVHNHIIRTTGAPVNTPALTRGTEIKSNASVCACRPFKREHRSSMKRNFKLVWIAVVNHRPISIVITRVYVHIRLGLGFG